MSERCVWQRCRRSPGRRCRKILRRPEALVAAAAAQGRSLIVLPEYFGILGGARPRTSSRLKERDGAGRSRRLLSRMAREHRAIVIGGSVPIASDDPTASAAPAWSTVPTARASRAMTRLHLFRFSQGAEDYDETRTIEPVTLRSHSTRPCGPRRVVDLLRRPLSELYRALGECALLLVPAAFTATTGAAHWELLLRTRAVENQCYVLAAAQGGLHPNGAGPGTFDAGRSLGAIVAMREEGPGVGGRPDVDPERLAEVRRQLPAFDASRAARSGALAAAQQHQHRAAAAGMLRRLGNRRALVQCASQLRTLPFSTGSRLRTSVPCRGFTRTQRMPRSRAPLTKSASASWASLGVHAMQVEFGLTPMSAPELARDVAAECPCERRSVRARTPVGFQVCGAGCSPYLPPRARRARRPACARDGAWPRKIEPHPIGRAQLLHVAICARQVDVGVGVLSGRQRALDRLRGLRLARHGCSDFLRTRGRRRRFGAGRPCGSRAAIEFEEFGHGGRVGRSRAADGK